jgi:hypothetical protein
MRPMPLDPIQEAIAHPPQRWDILRQQHQAERQHPNPEERENAEECSGDEQHAGNKPDPAERRPAQPTDDSLQTARQSVDHPFEQSLVTLRRGLARRRSAISGLGAVLHRTLSEDVVVMLAGVASKRQRVLRFCINIAPLVGGVLRRGSWPVMSGRLIGCSGPRHRPVQTRIGA